MTWSMPLGDSIETTSFSSREGGFTVNMPAEPQYEKQMRGEAGNRMEMQALLANYFRTEFSVMYVRHARRVAVMPGQKQCSRVLSEDTAQLRGKLMDEQPVSAGNTPGKGNHHVTA